MEDRRQAQIEAWLAAEDDQNEIYEDCSSSNAEEDHLEEQEHLSESEQGEELPGEASNSESEDVEPPQRNRRVNFYSGVDNTMWSKTGPLNRGRTRQHNIVFVAPGPKGIARQKTTPEACFALFLDDNIIDLLTKYTNIKIDYIKNKYARERDAKQTDAMEMRGYIGILLMAGVMKIGRLSVAQIFEHVKHTGIDAIYLTMSEQRFKFLTRTLRFDDVRDRPVRACIDKLAPIREFLDLFLINFQKYFIPSAEMTLDEQLLSFRGRCSFRQYIPSKPAKYGVKVFALVDVHYPYTFNLEIYAGQQPEGPFRLSNERHDVVMRLSRPVLGQNKNITMDNWFSSLRVAKELFENGTTMVATIRKDRREVPREFRIARGNPLCSSKFGFHQSCTLVSYIPKPNKVVILMSTMHNDSAIDADTGDRRKPEIITYYNRTKNGVDLVDKMCSLYDVSRNSRRWPLTVFFDLINLSALNALCIYTANKNYEAVRRRNFLIDLSLAWMKPQARRRLDNNKLPRSLVFKIKDFLGIIETENPATTSAQAPSTSVGRCYDCGRKRNKSTRKHCSTCKKFICGDHSKIVCLSCLENTN
ncbi:piggyBac transposable element-derived protein 4-like [Melitaea cinxia]|uniref:piggyBac transposable element-derived protein 4-like n=1 Tax=Melitaea cinxia TaxID=113334 RepID=UPI001E271C8F|nr:piggyBac transposable element-derived protein 4-like [Melitaea cinxia]